MRTTITLDEDVVHKLREQMRSSRSSFKEAVNSYLRQGLEQAQNENIAQPFAVEARPMGLRQGVDLSDIGGLIDFLDGPTTR